MRTKYPIGTTAAVSFNKLIEPDKELQGSERLSTRLVKSVSVLPSTREADADFDGKELAGWQMYCPAKGKVEMSVFGSDPLTDTDLNWICEKSARTSTDKADRMTRHYFKELYELYLPIAEAGKAYSGIGFNAQSNLGAGNDCVTKWPMHAFDQFAELVESMQAFGGAFRAVFGPAEAEEESTCRKKFTQTWNGNPADADVYMGHPVKVRCLFLLAEKPSIRFRTVLQDALPDAALRYLGSMDDEKIKSTWDIPLSDAQVLPGIAAQCLALEPMLSESVIGIETCHEPVKPIPASHDIRMQEGAVMVGRAMTTSGVRKNISIGEVDLKRHYQIIGQTGTGKSTMLANIIVNAIRQGHGLTFFDPHGSTIDVILKSVPEAYADRIRVVRIGDAENPVPLSMWDFDDHDPEKEARTISDISELFADIYDPYHRGFVGPRWERMFAVFAKAAIAIFGRRASFESIVILSQNQGNMYKAYEILVEKYPQLADTIKNEFGVNKSNDFVDLVSWFVAKFQRLTSVEQLQKTLGAGTNALDFPHSIDTNTVTLIDLASPVIGTPAARMIGTMILQKLWNAALARSNRNLMHMVILDEAQLFQTNPMPRMLAEARKFGLSMVLSTQSSFSLTDEIRDSLEANSANFSAFRLSPKDAAVAAIRFDDPRMQVSLTRQDAFRAVTSISVNGQQSAPFTLEISKPKTQPNAERLATRIEAESIKKLVKPYESVRALTAAEIQDVLNHKGTVKDSLDDTKLSEATEDVSLISRSPNGSDPEWLQDWTQTYNNMKKAS